MVEEGKLEIAPLLVKTKTRVDSRHNFIAKLLQPSVLPLVGSYVRWQAEVRQSPLGEEESYYRKMPLTSPISINLDPTSACNYSCPHCVDMDILNTGRQYDFDRLRSSIDLMHDKGLRSVIVIGGGEPTLYKEFEPLIAHLKERELQVAVVSNGTGMAKIANVGHLFDPEDWIRLSLDSGDNETFREMHLPKGRMAPAYQNASDNGNLKAKVPITLEQICQDVKEVRQQHPNLTIGFSYIVTWPGAHTNNHEIQSNVNQIRNAALLARANDFSYISLKAFLDREEETKAEIIGIERDHRYEETVSRIKHGIDTARDLETSSFKIIVSTNLRALLDGTEQDYMRQPVNCHMTNFRQVLGLRGISICPVYRGKDSAKIGGMYGYESEEALQSTRQIAAERIRNFDASHECKNVACMYMDANWFLESLIEEEIQTPGSINSLQPGPELNDYFL